jgi:hypothetical protein
MIRYQSCLLVLSLVTVIGCSGNKMLIRAELAPGTNVATYHTFAWLPVPPGIPGEPRQDNILLDQDIRATVDRELVAKGYAKAPPVRPTS